MINVDHAQSPASLLQIGLLTLPATAIFVCNCLKLERLNGGTSINAWDESERTDIKALEVLVFTLLLHLEVWALVETVDLVIDDSQQHLVALAARLVPAEFTQHFFLCSPSSSKEDFHHRYVDTC